MKILLLFAALLTLSGANAQCIGKHFITGAPVTVAESSGFTPGNAYAVSNWNGMGWPYTIYGPRFSLLGRLEQEFTRIHECAHLSIPTVDEVRANCAALREMRNRGLSEEEEAELAAWVRSEGQIGLQYGGTGTAFWDATLMCAGPRS